MALSQCTSTPLRTGSTPRPTNAKTAPMTMRTHETTLNHTINCAALMGDLCRPFVYGSGHSHRLVRFWSTRFVVAPRPPYGSITDHEIQIVAVSKTRPS